MRKAKTAIQTGYSHYQRRKSLNACLAILGAPIKDIYANPYKYGSHGQHRPVGGSIYARYTIEELYSMLKRYYHKSVKQYHHDITRDDARMKEINWAYDTGRRLLSKRGNPEGWLY